MALTQDFSAHFPAGHGRGIAGRRLVEPAGACRQCHARHCLCRPARRFRLESGPCRRDQGAEDPARRQGSRGGKRPGDRRLRQVHGVDGQPRWRQHRPGHLVRLLSIRLWSIWRKNMQRSSSATQRRFGMQAKHPKNLGSYFGYLNQAHYVDGVAAGLSTKSNKLGFVAAKPIALRAEQHQFVHAGRQEDQSRTPSVQVIFTGDWSLPVREAEAVNALVDAGCDVITCHVDGPKVVIETAEKRGVKTCGHNASPGAARAQGLHHRRRIQVGDDLQGLCRRSLPRARSCRT